MSGAGMSVAEPTGSVRGTQDPEAEAVLGVAAALLYANGSITEVELARAGLSSEILLEVIAHMWR